MGGGRFLLLEFGEELVWVKDVFGGDLGVSLPGCFSVLKRVLQKEASNAWKYQDAKATLLSTSGMTS